MDLGLKDKVIIVTGASRGIGRAIAETLAAEGAKLVLTARTKQQLKEVANVCGSETLIIPMDLRDEKAPQIMIETALARFGRIDGIVNNAGATKRGDFLELSEGDWYDGFALKFFGGMRCSRAAWTHLKASQGSIVNIVGIAGKTGNADFAIGGSVNSAILNLTKVLADKGMSDSVRVNAVNPGSIATERLQTQIMAFASQHNVDNDSATQSLVKKLGINRFGEPEEIAKVVTFLLSPAASYLNGSIIDVDGGQTRTL
ncbi:MAG TPA: SDR family oxidoreductase [Methylotenera sp.]|nr:SDR family oxidoreductase [Methylotenera sp.]